VSERHRFSRDAQRYLDGEPHGELRDEERAGADRLLDAVEAYTERLEPLNGSLDDAVLAALRDRVPPRRLTAWRWLLEPRQIRLRPIWVPVMAAAAALIVWLGGRAVTDGGRVPAGTEATADTVYVRFELVAPGAQLVSVAGSFNDWQPDSVRLARGEAGVWSTTLALPLGEHQYQFVVDGERWMPDPTAYAQVDDGFGGTNSLIVVGPRGVVRS
jgi:hypothetical protein